MWGEKKKGVRGEFFMVVCVPGSEHRSECERPCVAAIRYRIKTPDAQHTTPMSANANNWVLGSARPANGLRYRTVALKSIQLDLSNYKEFTGDAHPLSRIHFNSTRG